MKQPSADCGPSIAAPCSSLKLARITLDNDGSLRAPHGTIGNAIRKLRLARGLTQQQLADRVERSQSAIAFYENGRICPSVRTVMLMAVEFNVPLEYILAHRRTLFA